MLDKLPREVLLKLLLEFCAPEDAYFARSWCRAVSPIASRAFENHVRRMLDDLDMSLYLMIKRIRSTGWARAGFDGCLRSGQPLGTLFRKAGGTLEHTAVSQFIRDDFTQYDLVRGTSREVELGRFLRGLLQTPTHRQVRFLLDWQIISNVTSSVQMLKETQFDKALCVGAVLDCVRIPVSDRLVIRAGIEDWPRNELDETRLVGAISYLQKRFQGSERDLKASYSNLLSNLLDTHQLRYQACLCFPDDWEAVGRLLRLQMGGFVLELNHLADALGTVLLSSMAPGWIALRQPQTLDDRRSLILGMSGVSKLDDTLYPGNDEDQFLRAFLVPSAWPSRRELQAIDCIPPEFLRAEHDSRQPSHRSCKASIVALVRTFDFPAVVSFIYRSLEIESQSVVLVDRWTLEECCIAQCLCLSETWPDPVAVKVKRVAKIAETWTKSATTGDFFNSKKWPAYLQQLWQTVQSMASHTKDQGNLILKTDLHHRFFGVLCGASRFPPHLLSDFFGRKNNAALVTDMFSTYRKLGEFLLGYGLVRGEFPGISMDDALLRGWIFLAPPHVRTANKDERLDEKTKAKMMGTIARKLDEFKVALILGEN